MKTKLAACLILVFLLTPVYPIYAEDSTGSTTLTKPSLLDKYLNKRENVIAIRDAQKENLASRAAALKAKLALFKNKDKASLVEKINGYFVTINARATDDMTKRLNKMTEILGKLKQRVDEATPSAGQSKDDANKAIADAQTAIDTGKAAVLAQSQKGYIISISSESAARADASKTRDSFRTDLISTNDLVKAARKAVSNAISIAHSSLGGSLGTKNGK